MVLGINILDLPYGVVRSIFSHLTDIELFFNVRKTCRQLRGYVEDYIQIGNKMTCLLHNINKKNYITENLGLYEFT